MHGQLGSGDFVRLAWRLGREAATGRLDLLESNADHHVYLRRGYLTSARVAGAEQPLGRYLVAAGAVDEAGLAKALAAAGPRLAGHALRAHGLIDDAALDAALRRQAETRLERLAAIARASYRFVADAPPPPSHRSGRPLALTAWTRRHLEARFDGACARAFADEIGAARLVLRKDLAPDPADCDDTDRRILAALAAPRRLDEVARAAAAPRLRLLGFLGFLSRVGALERQAAAAAPLDLRRLGVPDGAPPEIVRRAYHRLARELHPDLNPDADPARLVDIIAAYRAYRDKRPSG